MLEVCVASVQSAVNAANGGADRLELNSALELGGLTPTETLLKTIGHETSLPVIAMVRPRAAGFRYSNSEKKLMVAEAETLLSLGAAGIAAGAINADRGVDVDFWQALRRVCQSRELVFHRAFDLIEDRHRALNQLIDCGTTRILTSGGQPTATAGATEIAVTIRAASGRIEILPASGISRDNVTQLLQATGCDQVHGSFSSPQSDPASPIADDQYPVTDQEHVQQVRRVLDQTG